MTTFGDVNRQVRLAVDEVNHIQLLVDLSRLTDDLYEQDLQAQLILTKAMNCHDQFWREKARTQSFINGDRNTVFFHRVASIKSSMKQITFLRDGNRNNTDTAEIE